VPTEPTVTAAGLYAQANEARKRGDLADAVSHYLSLQQRFPSSSEAKISHLTLGRLYLDRSNDPVRALAQIDAYLADDNSVLREEALVARAAALERLGRRAEERRAWEMLLAEFPSSVSADRARARLADLP
jgi:TolA-binding protein